MATKRVVLNGQTLIDLTLDTVTPEDVVQGKTFHGRDGEIYTGKYKPNIAALTITENGVYPIDGSVDGYGPITVEVTSGTVDPSQKAQLLPPVLSIDSETSTLTITDTRNDNHTEEYDIYFNGAYFMTVNQHIVKLNVYATIEDVVEVTATAKSQYFNTSVRSNTVLWWKETSSSSPTTGSKLSKPTIFVNGIKKTLHIYDPNSTSYTKGYDVYRNGELIISTTTSTNTVTARVIDLSEWIDYSEGEYFQVLIKRNPRYSYINSDLSDKHYVHLANEGTPGLTYSRTADTIDPYYTCTGLGSATDTEIVIPSYYNDEPVRVVSGFQSKTAITRVTLSPNVRTLNSSAFRYCSKLAVLDIPYTLNSIGQNALESTAITELDLSKNRISLSYYSLNTSYLNKLIIGEQTYGYGNNDIFSSSAPIREIHIKNIETWLKSSFTEGGSYYQRHPIRSNTVIYVDGEPLTDLIVPDGINSIPGGSFYNYQQLNTVDLKQAQTIGAYAFAQSSVKAVFSSKKLTKISQNAFRQCSSLKTFEFQTGLTTIEKQAFYYCPILEIYSLPNSLLTIGEQSFYNIPTLVELNLPNSISTIDSAAFAYCQNLEKINIPINVTTLNSTFSYCTKLISVDIPWGVSSLSGTFSNCSALASITLTNNVHTIGNGTFSSCINLQPFELPNQLTTIGSSAFYRCYLWDTVIIPDGVYSIGSRAFYECSALKYCKLGKSVISISDNIFEKCFSLETIEVHPENICWYSKNGVLYSIDNKKVISYALGNTQESLTLEDGATTIYSYVFEKTKLKEIYFPNSLTTINSYAFYYAELERATFGSSITTISSSAFEYSNIQEVILPRDFKTLGNNAFSQNKFLTKVRLGETITSIPSNAFSGCVELADIIIPQTMVTISSGAFSSCKKLKYLEIPENVRTIDSNAFSSAFQAERGTIVFLNPSFDTIGGSAFSGCKFDNFVLPPTTSFGGSVFSSADIELLDLRNLTLTYIPSSTFYSAKIKKLILWAAAARTDSYGFRNAKIDEITLLGSLPIASSNYNYQFENATFGQVNIINLEEWLTKASSAVSQNYGTISNLVYAASKNLIDENENTVTTLEIPSTVTSWNARVSSGFKWIETLILPDHLTTIDPTGFNDYYSLKDLYFNVKTSATTSFAQDGFTNAGEWQENGTTIHIGSSVLGIPSYFIARSASGRKHNFTSIDFSEASSCTGIGQRAFQYCYNIKEIIVPDTVTSLSSYCFYCCYGLQNCVLPSTLTAIPTYAFYFCRDLKAIEIPESCTSLGTYCFSNCYALTSITLPETITSIPSYCFTSCYGFRNFNFEHITSIGPYAFQSCYGLQELTIPSTLTLIDSYAFQYCYGLLKVTLEGGAPTINTQAFYQCYKLYEIVNYSSLSLTKGNSNYGYIAFYAKNIITPENQESIFVDVNNYVFYLNGTSWYLMGYVGEEEVLTLPESYNEENYLLNPYCFCGRTDIKSIVFPNTITTIPVFCCARSMGLETIEVPEWITKIENEAFAYNYNLKTLIYKAKKLTSSGSNIFSGCGLYGNGVDVTITESVEVFPGNLFGTQSGNTSKLKTLNIVKPKGLTINSSCFGQYCTTNLLEVHIPTIESWFEIIFANGTSNPLNIAGTKLYFEENILFENLSQVNYENITNISDYIFYKYGYLVNATIPEGISIIGRSAFYASSIEQLTIPTSVTKIGDYAFSNCYSLEEINYHAQTIASTSSSSKIFDAPSVSGIGLVTSLYISKEVRRITEYLFSNMYYLQNIIFEEGAKNIVFDSNVFTSSTQIKKVNIDNLENWLSFSFTNGDSNPISNFATTTLYANNQAITELTIPETVTKIPAYSFYQYSPLTKIDIPAHLTLIETNALSFTPNVTSIVVDSASDYFILENGLLFDKDKTQLRCAIKTVPENIVLPDGILELDDGTFYQVTTLKTIQLPNTVTKIGDYVFQSCTSLEEINLPIDLSYIGTYSFYYCQKLKKLYYNARNIQDFSSGRNMVFYSIGQTNKDLVVYIGNTVERLPNYLFAPYGTENNYSQNAIKQVIFAEDSVCTTIGSYAFRYATSLEEISLPASLTTISSYAFEYCSALSTIIIPINVTTIGGYAFQYCSKLQIFAEVASKPSGWNSYWNNSSRPVVWGYDGYEYTIQFVTNCDQIVESVTSLGMIQLPLLIQEDYGLLGWHTQEDFSDTGFMPLQLIHGSQIPHDENYTGTLYAKWVPISEMDGTSMARAIPIAENTVVTVTTISGLKYYRFIPTQSKTYTYRSYDGNPHVDAWGNIMNSSGTQLTYNDDGASNAQFTMNYNMTAGTVYYLGARLYSQSAGGVFTIKIY